MKKYPHGEGLAFINLIDELSEFHESVYIKFDDVMECIHIVAPKSYNLKNILQKYNGDTYTQLEPNDIFSKEEITFKIFKDLFVNSLIIAPGPTISFYISFKYNGEDYTYKYKIQNDEINHHLSPGNDSFQMDNGIYLSVPFLGNYDKVKRWYLSYINCGQNTSNVFFSSDFVNEENRCDFSLIRKSFFRE